MRTREPRVEGASQTCPMWQEAVEAVLHMFATSVIVPAIDVVDLSMLFTCVPRFALIN